MIHTDTTAPQPAPVTADAALALLKQGNRNYLDNIPVAAEHIGHSQRLALAKKQQPFCVLVGCSDSRVPPELLFGRGLGELFIVRNAGNVVDGAGLGSIEYAVLVLKVPLIVVLGHQGCGAVKAAIDVVRDDAIFPGHIGHMVEAIVPAVLRAQRHGNPHADDSTKEADDLLDRSVCENVRRIVARLQGTATLQAAQQAGALKIVGARYNLADGTVDFLDD